MSDTDPPVITPEEVRYLILKMIEQAVRDYLSLEKTSAPIERYYYETACEFLFDDDYVVEFGGANKTLHEFLSILDIDRTWFRERVIRAKNSKCKEELCHYRIVEEEDEDPEKA